MRRWTRSVRPVSSVSVNLPDEAGFDFEFNSGLAPDNVPVDVVIDVSAFEGTANIPVNNEPRRPEPAEESPGGE